MAGRTLGEAWVTIRPATAAFRPELETGLKKAMAGLKPTIKVTLEISDSAAQMRAKLNAATKGLKVKIGAEADDADLAKTRAKIAAATSGRKVKVDVDTKALQDQVVSAWMRAEQAIEHMGGLEIPVDNRSLSRSFEAVNVQLGQLAAKAENVKMDPRQVDAFTRAVEAATGRVNSLDDRLELTAERTRAAADAMAKAKPAEIPVTVTDPKLTAEIAALKARAQAQMDALGGLKISFNDRVAEASADALIARLQVQLSKMNAGLKTDIDVRQAAANIASLTAQGMKLRNTLDMSRQNIPSLDITLATSQLTHLGQQADKLGQDMERAISPAGITFGKVTEEAKNDLKQLQPALEKVRQEIAAVNSRGIVNEDDIARVKSLQNALGGLTKAVSDNGVRVSSTTKSYRGMINTLIDVSRTEIPLFSGAFDKVLPHMLAVASGFHIITEAAIETVAVWIPAAVALGVFAVAAQKTARQVYTDTRNMQTAASGTGQAFAGMGQKAGKSLSDIAKPYVYTAFGLGMIAMQKQSKTTGTVVQNMGSTINKWMAEAVMAYQKSTGQMSLTGSKDFAILGDAFKQLGTAIGAFIKMTPGYAEDLLKLGDGVLHLVSAVLNSPVVQAVGKMALAFHGLFFYLGLGVTLFTKFSSVLLKPLAGISLFSGALSKMGVEANSTEGKMSKLGTAMVDGWNSGTGRLSTSVEHTMDDMGNIMVQAGPKLEGSAETVAAGTMGKMKTAFATGMEAVAATVAQGGMSIKGKLGADVEGSTAGAAQKFTAFKVAAGDAMTGLAGTVSTASKGIKGSLGGLFTSLGINPLIAGLAVAGAAIALMYHNIQGYTQATKDFIATADEKLGNTASISQFGQVMDAQLKQANVGLVASKKNLNSFTIEAQRLNGTNTSGISDLFNGFTNMIGLGKKLPQSVADATAAFKAQQAAVQHLTGENANYQANLKAIGKANGVDLPEAFALSQVAGVSVTDMLKDQGNQMAINVLETKAANSAFGSLTMGIGGVKTAYSALAIQNSQTMQNAQSVAGAFANFTSLITGGANAFDSWAQGETELNKNISQTGDVSTSVTLKLGKFSDKLAVTGKGMDGTSTAAIAANQAFLAQVNNSQALYGSLIQLAAASGNTGAAQHALSESGKDMVSTLLKTAGGSKSAQTQIFALAQTFGYAGKSTIPELVKWLGRTGDKTQGLQKNMNALTGAAGNLGNAAKALAGNLSGDLLQAEAKSIIDAKGGAGAFTQFAKAVGAWSKNANPKSMNAMIKSGQNLKSVFISAAGSADAAVPALAAYMMQLGAKNQKQATQMARAILGIGNAAGKTGGPVNGSAAAIQQLGQQLKVTPVLARMLWSELGKQNLDWLTGKSNNAKSTIGKLASALHATPSQASALWSVFGKQNLDWIAGKTSGTKNAFLKLLEQMHLTPPEAQAVWAALGKQNLDMLSSKIGANRSQFEQWGVQAGTSAGKANTLWQILAKNNFDPLTGNVAQNKAQFMSWAGQVGISTSKAATLWAQLMKNSQAENNTSAATARLTAAHGQLVKILGAATSAGHITAGQMSVLTSAMETNANKVDTSKSAFEAFAAKLGISKTQADNLWASLKNVAGTYAANVKVNVSGGGTVKVQGDVSVSGGTSIPGQQGQNGGIGTSLKTGEKTFNGYSYARGGKLPGWHNTGDNMLASSPMGPVALQGGEAVVPKNLATHPEFASFAKRKGIPGYASGGLISGSVSGALDNSQVEGVLGPVHETGFAGRVGKSISDTTVKALAAALKTGIHQAYMQAQAALNAPSAAGISSGASMQNGKAIFDYLRTAGFAPVAAAGAIAGMYGESGWNPESHEPPGPDGAYNGGLMGFTPLYNYLGHISGERSNVPDSIVTGNATSDFQHQLQAIIEYLHAFNMTGVVAQMNSAGSVFDAANLWGVGVEKFGVNDVHSTGLALAQQIMTGDKLTQQGSTVTDTKTKIGTSAKTGEQTFNGYSYAQGGVIPGYAGGGKVRNLATAGNVFGATDSHMPEWARFTSRELKNRKDAEQAQAQKFKNAMNRDSGAGLTGKYLTDSEQFKTWNDRLTGTKAAITRRTAFNKESPAQQAKDIANVDLAVSKLYAHEQATAFGQLQKMGTGVTHLKKSKPKRAKGESLATYDKALATWNKNLGSDNKNYQAALEEFMKTGQLSSKWMSTYNKRMAQEEKLSKKAGGGGSLLRMKSPTNSVMKLSEALTTDPWVGKLSSGIGSTSALGWAMQPVLGDMMIASTFNPKQWVGKSATNATYSAEAANWTATMEAIGGFLNSQAGLNAVQLAGAATKIHGKQTQGPRKSFMTGGTLHEDVMGTGRTTGEIYKFHSSDSITGPAIAKTQNATADNSNVERLLSMIVQRLDQGNTITQGQGREFARELNGNAGRRVR